MKKYILDEDLKVLNMVATDGNKKIKTDDFGIYSPSNGKFLAYSKGKCNITTNDEFISAIETIKNNKLNLVNIINISSGGKIMAKFEVKVDNTAYKANLYIIESNDRSSKLGIICEVLFNNDSGVLLPDNFNVTLNKNSSFGLRFENLKNKLIETSIDKINKFIDSLDGLQHNDVSDTQVSIMLNKIYNSTKMNGSKSMVTIETIKQNYKDISLKDGKNLLSLFKAISYELRGKNNLNIPGEKNEEFERVANNYDIYFYRTLRQKNNDVFKVFKSKMKSYV